MPQLNRLAVLITYHNEGELLRRCLTSLAGQTRPVDEIIVHDDASAVRPDSHIPRGLPIRVVRTEPNVGPARARNTLLRETEATFIHFHDADDEFAATWSAKVLEALEVPDTDAVFTEVSWIAETGGRAQQDLGLSAVAAGADLVRFCIRGALLVPAGTYRRDAVTAVGGYRESLWQSEDWDFHVRLAANRIRFQILREPLVVIHRRADSRSELRREVWVSALQAAELLAGELSTDYRQDLSDAAGRIGSTLFQLGARAEARRAFSLAAQLGQPTFGHLRPLARVLARLGGPEAAERVGAAYRRVLPVGLRGILGSRGQAPTGEP